MGVNTSSCLQVLGLFAVTATAAGSLYFLDTNRVASSSGLNAAAILILLLNLAFLLVASAAVASAASDAVRVFIRRHYNKLISRAHNNSGVHALRQIVHGVSFRSRRSDPLHQMSVQIITADDQHVY